MCDKYLNYVPGVEPPTRMFSQYNCGTSTAHIEGSNDAIAHDMAAVYPQLSNWTSSMVIPPNTMAEIRNVPWTQWKSDGTWGYRSQVPSGKYDNITTAVQQWPTNCKTAPGTSTETCGPAISWDNGIRSIRTTRKRTWDEHSTQCCARLLGSGECPGFYGPNSHSGCDQYMLGYCAANPDQMGSGVCAEWYLPQKSREDTVKKAVCNRADNLGHPACREWCRQHPGECDAGAIAYCSENPADILCACLTSPVTRYNPACVDAKCIAGVMPGSEGIGGYVTASMTSKPCPDIVDCSTQVELESGGRTTTGSINVAQNCGEGGTGTGGTGSGGTGSGGTGTGGTGTPTPKKETNWMMILLVFVLLLAIAGTVGAVIYFRKKAAAATPESLK